jgi:Alpha/beta hydrolase
MSGTYARLRITDPGRWQAAASAWRGWAGLGGRWGTALAPLATRLASAWSGAAAAAALGRLTLWRRVLDLFRLLCWEVDQALSEFAAALARAQLLLARARAAAAGAGLTVDDRGRVIAPQTPAGRGTAVDDHGRVIAPQGPAGGGTAEPAAAGQATADLTAALTVAETADAAAAGRLTEVAAMAATGPPPRPVTLPSCTASPAEVRRWWDALSPAQRRWLVVTDAAWVGALDGVPVEFRDAANRLLLDRRRDDMDAAALAAHGRERHRLDGLRRGLRGLSDRLARDDGPRAYLLRLDSAGDGRVVVALGDPDRADNVLTHVPGMTADLGSYRGELARAERVAVRAAELGPGASTSTVMWLDYDAPDFVDEAAGTGRARAGAAALRHFQDGLRATHDGGGRRIVLGHSYGSLVVGEAAAQPGLAADDVVFVGSPGVGVDRAADLHVPAGHVWSTTSRSDVIQYTAVAPGGVLGDLVTAGTVPIIGPAVAFATPEDDLWFGRNPSDPSFGAEVFRSPADAGHVGYWDPGRPALDAITAIALGVTPP